MIKVTRLNDTEFYINPNLIETIEETPNTVLKLVNDKKLIVKEKTTEIIERIKEYNRDIYNQKTRT